MSEEARDARRASLTSPPRKPLPAEPVADSAGSDQAGPQKLRTSQSGDLLRGRPPPPAHLRNSGRGSQRASGEVVKAPSPLPRTSSGGARTSVGVVRKVQVKDRSSQAQGIKSPPMKRPPRPPGTEMKKDQPPTEPAPVISQEQADSQPVISPSSSGSWKGATSRASGARSSGGLVISRVRGATVMSDQLSRSSDGSDSPGRKRVDSPGRAVGVIGGGEVSPPSILSPPMSPKAGSADESDVLDIRAPGDRRWSFLTNDEDGLEEDNAQCYLWGILGKQVRSVPKAPKLDALGEANVKLVVGGSDHFLLLTDAGIVFSWGGGGFGALGHGDTMPRLTPSLVEGLSAQNIQGISAAKNHSAAITDRGILYHWGTIGVPGIEMSMVPKTRSELKGNIIDEVSLGDKFVICLLRGGNLIAWGDNSEGQLGCGSSNMISVLPIVYSLEEKVAHVFCGSNAAGAVTLRNNAFVWGANWAKPAKPHRAPQRVLVKSKVQSLAFGSRHCVLLSCDGRVYIMGENSRYQLGLPSSDEVRPSFVLQPILMDDDDDTMSGGTVSASSPSMSRPSSTSGASNSPVIDTKKTFRLKGLVNNLRRTTGSGKAPASGGAVGTSVVMDSSHNDFIRIKQIAAGATHTAALTAAGKVYEWGQMSLAFDSSKESRSQLKPTPIIVEALDGVSVESLRCSANAVLAVVGLKNERDLKFLSFNPPIIKLASLERLIDWLIRESRGPTDTFDYHFLLTLNTFTTPQEVLSLLLDRIESENSSQSETRIVGIVYKWMRKRPKDFFEENEQNMVKRLVSSAADLKIAIMKELSKLETLKRVRTSRSESQGEYNNVSVDLLKVDPSIVAEQLTLIEESLVAELDVRELLQNAWSKSDKDVRAPNVIKIIANFNRLSYFVTTFMVSGTSIEDRSRRAQFWGDVLKHVFALNNLNTAMAISSAFQSVPFHRLLKRELVEVKLGTQRYLEQIGGLMKGNKAGYRRKMEGFLSSGEPAIPYLAVHLSDLTFLEDGNPNYVDDLINMQKRHLIGKQIGPLEKLQSRRYITFSKNPRLRNYLSRMEGYDETALDHLVEKIIEQEKAAGGSQRGEMSTSMGRSYDSLKNRSEQVAMLEAEAQTSGDGRVQVWKEWFLRFSERGGDFLQTWRLSRAWEMSLQNLLHKPPTRRESELFVDIMCKMMLGSAPYIPSAIATLIECAKTEPSPEIEEKVIAFLTPYKLALLDARSDSSPRRAGVDSVDQEAHAEVLAGMRKDRRRLPKLQLVLMSTPPTLLDDEDLHEVARLFKDQIPAEEECIATRQQELHAVVEEEKKVSETFDEGMSELDKRLATLKAREEQLKQELENVQKQVAEAEANRKQLSKEGEHQMSSISLRKRIADTELSDVTKMVDALGSASSSWDKFASSLHVDYIKKAAASHQGAHEWLRTRLERIYAFLLMHRDNLDKSAGELAARGGQSLLATEAWKVAQQEAHAFLEEASQFLAALPAALHELHAKILDQIVMLRAEVQEICGQDKNAAAERGSRVGSGEKPDVPSQPVTASPAQGEPEEKFVLPSQRLVLSPAPSRNSTGANSAFVLPSERLSSNNLNSNGEE